MLTKNTITVGRNKYSPRQIFEYYCRKDLPYILANSIHRTHKNNVITFKGHEYLHEIYRCQSKKIVIKKGTQCGISEWLIVMAISKAITGRSVFYVLPTWELKNRFVKNRFDTSLKHSGLYELTMSKTRGLFAESTALKHIGTGAITFLGSFSAGSFTEFAADDVIIDELDRCDQENIAMAPERLSHSHDPREIEVSNPTFIDFGIDSRYNKSDQRVWTIKCSSCGKSIQPDFFTHVVREEGDGNYYVVDKNWEKDHGSVQAICDKCDKPFDRFAPGVWIPTYKNKDVAGFCISKMFSTNVPISTLIDSFQEGFTSDIKMQRFYNADLGMAYTAKGARITDGMLDDCVDQDYTTPERLRNGVSSMGVDVGAVLHVKINRILPDKDVTVFIGTIPISDSDKDLKELVRLWNRFSCKVGIIDAAPEMRLSRRACRMMNGMLRWNHHEQDKEAVDFKKRTIKINRNLLIDDTKEAILTKRLVLPRNAKKMSPLTPRGISEYYDNMTSSTRTFDEKSGKYKWIESRPDHYLFAESYALFGRHLLRAYAPNVTGEIIKET